jgi:hypothetical protein
LSALGNDIERGWFQGTQAPNCPRSERGAPHRNLSKSQPSGRRAIPWRGGCRPWVAPRSRLQCSAPTTQRQVTHTSRALSNRRRSWPSTAIVTEFDAAHRPERGDHQRHRLTRHDEGRLKPHVGSRHRMQRFRQHDAPRRIREHQLGEPARVPSAPSRLTREP